MKINIILILFIIILGLLFVNNDNKRNRRLYIIICSAVFLFVASMRSPEYMTYTYLIDTLNYKQFFESSFDMTWEECLTMARMRYFGDAADESDIGYIAFNKLIGIFTHDFAVFSLLAQLLFFIPFGVLLYRYCTNIYSIIFAFVYYISLIQVYLIGGGRQMYAIGLDIIALFAVIDGKKLRAIIFFLLGLTIHSSSFLFLAPLLMVWYGTGARMQKMIHIVCFVLFPVVYVIPNTLISFMGAATGIEKFEAYGKGVIQGGANTFIFLVEFLSLFCLIAIKKKDILLSTNIKIFYSMLPFITFLAPLVRSNGTMIRIALYYSIFLTLLIPYAIECQFERKDKNLAYIAAIGMLSILAILNGGMTYYFYWQV